MSETSAPVPCSDVPQGPSGLHASAVAFGDRAVLIRGASGSGKSALALALLARRLFDGTAGRLVADDRVCLVRADDDGALLASAPDALRGLIEVRSVGLLRLPFAPTGRVELVVDLHPADELGERLPDPRVAWLLGEPVPLVRWRAREAGPAADLVVALLSGARLLDPNDAA